MDTLFTPGIFALTLLLSSRNAAAGIGAMLFAGCFYGILRANHLGLPAYFFFDAALLGCYSGCLFNREFISRPAPRGLTRWLTPMLIWPLMLMPLDDSFLVSLVGLRAAVLFLPVVLLGTRLRSDELLVVCRIVAIATFAVTLFALLENARSVEYYYPRNEVTTIIYNSSDVNVGSKSALRIPATFAHAAVYAGTMVIFVPFMLHGAERDWPLLKPFFFAALVCCVIGVFMSSTRTAVIYLAFSAIFVIVRVPSIVFNKYVAVGTLGIFLIGYSFIGDNPRFQRFKTLGDEHVVTKRYNDSNLQLSLIDFAIRYPIGGGLALTGVSLPKFITRTTPGISTENEYARIVCTQGIPGLLLFLGFIGSCISAGLRATPRMSSTTSNATTGILIMVVVSGLVGVGTYVSVPSSAALFLLLGYQAAALRKPNEAGGEADSEIHAKTA